MDITGPNGGVIRIDDIEIDDIEIEDITSAFHRNMMNIVDVCDLGAAGDGVTDDHAAFVTAEQAAERRKILGACWDILYRFLANSNRSGGV